MKSFKQFMEDGAAAVGAASGGAIATTTTAGVKGTGADKDTVPVSKKAQRRISSQPSLHTRTARLMPHGPVEEEKSPRRITTPVNFKQFKVGSGVGPQTFMTKEGLREDTKKAQKEITSANSKTHPNPTGFVKVGDTGHLGFGAKGGAGFTGTVSKIEGDLVHLTSKYNPNKTYRGHVSKFTKS